MRQGHVGKTAREHRPAGSVLLACALVLAIAIAACGGGGDADDGPPPWSGVTIEQPTETSAWTTATASVSLAGRAFVPTGSRCDAAIGTVAQGYAVVWRNAASGASGTANVRLHCVLQVNLAWDTLPIALATGANAISVTATAADGRTGSDTITVTRVDPAP